LSSVEVIMMNLKVEVERKDEKRLAKVGEVWL
jgi:hypothetical protein